MANTTPHVAANLDTSIGHPIESQERLQSPPIYHEMNETRKNCALLFWSILVVALALRLYLALSTIYIWDEERDWLPLADSISFHNLPLRGDFHPALPAYFMKAGSLLLGRNPLGFRFFNLIAGVLTIALIFKFTLEWTNSLAASFWASSLLAFNEYHIAASILAVQKSLFLLFALLAMAAFIRFLSTERSIYLYMTAATIGLSFLCHEPGILLLPIFFIIILFPKYRHWLKRRETYLAAVVFFVIIFPDIYWNLRHHGPTQVNLADRFSQFELGFTPQPLMFYFHGTVLRIYSHFNIKLNPWLHYPHQNLIFGSMLFGGVILVMLRRGLKSHALILLALLFWSIFCFFLLMPSNHPMPASLGSAAFYWIDITLLPAVVLTGHAFAGIAKRWQPALYALFTIGGIYGVARILIFNLGLPVLGVAYDPAFISHPDGRMVDVQAKFMSCMLCERAPKVELLDIKTIDEANNVSSPGVNTPDVAGAAFGTDDRTFTLRAIGARRYEIIYRVTYSTGKVYVLAGGPAGARAVHVVTYAEPLSRSVFWVN